MENFYFYENKSTRSLYKNMVSSDWNDSSIQSLYWPWQKISYLTSIDPYKLFVVYVCQKMRK